jgi:hypothetical protein
MSLLAMSIVMTIVLAGMAKIGDAIVVIAELAGKQNNIVTEHGMHGLKHGNY